MFKKVRRSILGLSVGAVVALSGCSADRTLEGIWYDSAADYRVVFDSGGNYYDSDYNLQLEYEYKDDSVVYYTPAGDMVYAVPTWTVGGDLHLYIGGKNRVLERVDDLGPMYDWSVEPLIDQSKVTQRYTIKSALPVESGLELTSDTTFSMTMSGAETETIKGRYASSQDNRNLVLYYSDGQSLDALYCSPYGLYLGSFPMKPDGSLVVTTDYHNKTLNQESGYLLEGVVLCDLTSTSFVFTPDSRCVKSVSGGTSVEYSYYVDTEGLVTLGSAEGVISDDYMLYDPESNTIYRVVYQRDSWFDYVSELTSPDQSNDTQSAGEDSTHAIVSPADFLQYLPLEFNLANLWCYKHLSVLDVEYTKSCEEEILAMRDKIEADAIARREYELSLLTERERFFARAKEQEEERNRIKAEMDARVEAEIASGTSGTQTSAQEWLEQYYATQQSSSSGGSSSSSTSTTVPPGDEGQGATEEPVTSEEQSEEKTEVEYDPVFSVSFVCTCVNCYVQSLPVELNADNILLVDSSVIAPETRVNLEGYGLVVTRASDGYTIGQTAVCYSNSHNAVNRFSSGTYNVQLIVN